MNDHVPIVRAATGWKLFVMNLTRAWQQYWCQHTYTFQLSYRMDRQPNSSMLVCTKCGHVQAKRIV